jgi:hypothetical protein
VPLLLLAWTRAGTVDGDAAAAAVAGPGLPQLQVFDLLFLDFSTLPATVPVAVAMLLREGAELRTPRLRLWGYGEDRPAG